MQLSENEDSGGIFDKDVCESGNKDATIPVLESLEEVKIYDTIFYNLK